MRTQQGTHTLVISWPCPWQGFLGVPFLLYLALGLVSRLEVWLAVWPLDVCSKCFGTQILSWVCWAWRGFFGSHVGLMWGRWKGITLEWVVMSGVGARIGFGWVVKLGLAVVSSWVDDDKGGVAGGDSCWGYEEWLSSKGIPWSLVEVEVFSKGLKGINNFCDLWTM